MFVDTKLWSLNLLYKYAQQIEKYIWTDFSFAVSDRRETALNQQFNQNLNITLTF